MWQLLLCQWPCELSQRRCEGGCWNAKASVSSTVHASTVSTAAHLRYNSQACISRERSWTSLMIYLYREQSPYLISVWMLNYAARGGRWNDPWKTNKPLWLTRHPAEGEELSQGLIQSDIFVFVWIAPMLGVRGTIHSGTHHCWNVLWAHDSLNSAVFFMLAEVDVKSPNDWKTVVNNFAPFSFHTCSFMGYPPPW